MEFEEVDGPCNIFTKDRPITESIYSYRGFVEKSVIFRTGVKESIFRPSPQHTDKGNRDVV